MKDPEQAGRWLSACWESGSEQFTSEVFEASLQIVAENVIGILANVSMTLADMKVQITQINTQTRPNGTVIMNLTVSCKSVGHLGSIVSRLKSIPNVLDVHR